MLTDLGIPPGIQGTVGLVADNTFTRFSPHRHLPSEINLVVSGSATLLANDTCIELTAGNCILIPSCVPHTLIQTSDAIELWVLTHRDHFGIQANQAPSQQHATAPICGKLDSDSVLYLKTIIERLINENHQEAFNSGLAYCFHFLLNHASLKHDTPEQRAVHPALFKVIESLRNEEYETTLEALAKENYISTSHLLRIIKNETELTFTDLRNKIRLERFFEIRNRNKNRNLLAAALEAGFGSYSQFVRVYRNHTGHSPRKSKTTANP